jgi:acyl carrier protein
MSPPQMQPALEVVIATVRDLTQDWGIELDSPMQGDTLLAGELGFASVDIIQLCVALEQHYERRLGFQELLMANGSYVGDVTLGEFARFIEKKLQRGDRP